MKLKISIDMDNDAFDHDRCTEVAEILGRITDAINIGHSNGPVRDTNGNTVGEWGIA